jgi:DNA-binding transcriptional regulator YhcF (GntR family)
VRDIILTRKSRDLVRDQLQAQVEMKMLSGQLAPGARLPSIRAFARMLRINPNTVSAVYRRLESLGRLHRRRGAGMFVDSVEADGHGAPRLDAVVHAAMRNCILQGYSAAEIRDEVGRWMSAPPPDRIVVFDPVREMAELLASELRDALGVLTEDVTVEDLEAAPGPDLRGALVGALPFQVRSLSRFLRREAFEVLNVHMPDTVRDALKSLPADSAVLVISSSRVVVQFAQGLIRSLRGHDLPAHLHHIRAESDWRPVLGIADLVITDIVSAPAVRASTRHPVLEMRILTPQTIAIMRAMLTLPHNPLTGLRR